MPLNRGLILDRLSARGLTQADLARVLGVAYPTLYRWMIGSRSPSLDHLSALARILDLTLDDLVVTPPLG